jgi:hypothetical protein
MRKVIVGLACLAAVGAVACQVQGSCETTPAFPEYCSGNASDAAPCQGHIDAFPDVVYWQSAPQDAPFLNYGAEQQWHMHFRDEQTGQTVSGTLANLLVQVSASQNGNATNWIVGADQLVEATMDGDGAGISIRNDTCGAYFFRVVVTLVPNSTTTDAGTD